MKIKKIGAGFLIMLIMSVALIVPASAFSGTYYAEIRGTTSYKEMSINGVTGSTTLTHYCDPNDAGWQSGYHLTDYLYANGSYVASFQNFEGTTISATGYYSTPTTIKISIENYWQYNMDRAYQSAHQP